MSLGCRSTAGIVLALGLGAAGCPHDSDLVCDGAGDPEVRVFQRGQDEEILDGSDVPVFPPPQGGVFTELDVRLSGVTTDEIESIRVDIVDEAGALLAAQLYNGQGLPLACQVNGSILIEDMPVGFNASVVLEELDGVPVTMTTRLSHPGGETEAQISATLRATEY